MFFWLLGCLLVSDKVLQVTAKHTYDPVPEEAGYMEEVYDYALDARGWLYALDIRANKIWIWDDQQHFVKHFGRKGNGPGEFNFAEESQAYVHLTINKDKICVLDSMKKVMLLYDLDGNYLKLLPFKGNGGLTTFFEATKNGSFLMAQQHYYKRSPYSDIVLYDAELKKVKQIARFEEQFFKPEIKDDQLIRWNINFLAPELTLFADSGSEEVVVGLNEGPWFDIYNDKGEEVRKVKYGLVAPDVMPLFVAEYKKLYENVPNAKISIPKKMPYYQRILPVGDRGYLVCYSTIVSRQYMGWLVSKEGKIEGRFQYACGENGGIDGLQGRLFALKQDDEGNYTLSELTIK